MQVLVGPTYSMEASASASSPARVRDRSSSVSTSSAAAAAAAAQDNNNRAVSSSCLFLNNGDENDVVGDQDNDSSDSSSIGAPGDSEDEDEVGLPRNKLSMDSLEDSLPTNIKRGLSNHYSGKSKSFGNLTEVKSKSTGIKDLEKEENPFNKRRRLLIANKWSRKFFYSRHNPKSMPLLPIIPDEEPANINDDDDQVTSKQDEDHEQLMHGKSKQLQVKMGFKSQSCFCLADLAEEEEVEEDDDDY